MAGGEETVILAALGSRGGLIWLKMKRKGQSQRRVEREDEDSVQGGRDRWENTSR